MTYRPIVTFTWLGNSGPHFLGGEYKCEYHLRNQAKPRCENCPNHWIENYPLVITHGNGTSVVNRVLYLGKTSNEMVDFPAMFDDTWGYLPSYHIISYYIISYYIILCHIRSYYIISYYIISYYIISYCITVHIPWISHHGYIPIKYSH